MRSDSMENVLLAIGNKSFSSIILKHLEKHSGSFHIANQEVMHHRYLEELIEVEKPDILIVHDYHLPSDKSTQEEREEEWLSFIQRVRAKYDNQLRIVFLCEREKGDPFLSYLVSTNVLDIFNSRMIDMEDFIDQLKDTPRFKRVAKFVTKEVPIAPPSDEDEEESSEELTEPPKKKTKEKKEPRPPKEKKPEKPPRPIVKKEVTKKVVNKQVVKRDFNIQVSNQVERIVGVPIEKKLVMIGSHFSRTGSTFISHLLARQLARLGVTVSYIENPYGSCYTYDRFIGHERTSNYRSKFYQLAKNPKYKDELSFDWVQDGINLISRNPSEERNYETDDIPFDVFIKVILSAPTNVTIIDVGTDWNKPIYRDIFDIATNAFFVVEPDISSIQHLEDPENTATAYFHDYMENEKSSLIGNRFDPEILKNEVIKELYADKLIASIPTFPSKDVFDTQYKGSFLNDTRQYSKLIATQLDPLLSELLPKEFLKKAQRRKNGLVKGLFNKKITIQQASEGGNS